MALINHAKKEVNAKIVYYGPGSAGKETSLAHIYRKLSPELRSSFKSMEVQGGRMLFFDFQPSDKGIDGYAVRFHVYTVPGDAPEASLWRLVLKGVDGIVFVADSDPARQGENTARMKELQELLGAGGQSLDQVSLVLQYNRRDHTAALPVADLEQHLNLRGVLALPTVATTGEGVLAPLSALIKMVLGTVRESLGGAAGREIVSVPLPVSPVTDNEALPVPPGVPEGAELQRTATHPQPSALIVGAEVCPDSIVQIPVEMSCGDSTRRFRLTLSLKLEEMD